MRPYYAIVYVDYEEELKILVYLGEFADEGSALYKANYLIDKYEWRSFSLVTDIGDYVRILNENEEED